MSRNSPMGQLGMKLPLRRPTQEEPAPTTPRWPPRYGEPAAPQHQQAPQHHQLPDYAQHGQSQQQAPGYYFPQAGREADQGHGYAPQGMGQHHQHGAPAPAQHGSLPFNRLPGGADAGAGPSAHGSNPSLPFGRFPPPAGEAEPNYGYPQQGVEPSFGGYADGLGHQQQPGAGSPPWSQQPDARGFDLGTYMPAQGQAPGHAYQQADQQHDPSVFGGQQHGYAETEQEYDETFGEEEEPPASGRRGLMIVAALVGAIGLGGGMAYTYKTFFAPRSGPAVVIKDTQGPAKSKPEVADGKGFPHTDKKLLARLGEDANRPPPQAEGPANADASGDRLGDDPNGPRRVRTIPIMPGGGAPPASPPQMAAASAPPPSGGAPMVTVPGVTLENFGMPRPPPQAQAMPRPPMVPQQAAPPSAARIELPTAAAAPPARPVQPPMRPVTVTASATPPSAAAPAAAPPAQKPVKAAVPKSKQPAPVATTGTSGGSGYVAVLSSKKTRMDALKVFADMQQKYGDVLSAKTPDVQEANLGEKGVWYRAVVGPPGSREAAANLCSQLKTAGHEGCWVTAY